MLKYLSFLCFGVFYVLVWATEDHNPLSDKEILILKENWEKCCEKNICILNSCFFAQRSSSDWPAIRQRCQGELADWPGVIDLFQIRKEEDLQELSYLLQRFSDDEPEGDLTPEEVWTGGVRCPKSTSKGPFNYFTRWTSTDDPFPEWLEDKIPDPDDKYHETDCKFLVFTLAQNISDAKYEFQDQSSNHPGICEFVLPEEAFLTLPSETTTLEHTTSTFQLKTVNASETETSTDIQFSTTSEIKSKTLNPSEKLNTSSTLVLGTTIGTTTTAVILSTTTTPTTDNNASTTSSISPTVINIDRHCKGKKKVGIDWPDTMAGATVNKSCPEGMTGYAQWRCDNLTLQFTPRNPHVEDCRHVWIKDLEENVENGADAVDISTELARDTKKEKMSHGDITALMDLTVKILHLFSSQHENKDPLKTNKTKPYIFTRQMVSSMSNILRAEIKDAWEILPAKHQTRAASKMLQIVSIIGSHLSCIKESKSKLQHTVTAENIDLQTFILNTEQQDENEKIVFPQKVEGMKANSSLTVPAYLKWKKPLTTCIDYNTAVGVLYKHVGDFLKGENLSSSHLKVVTKVISFSMNNNTETTILPKEKSVTIVLRHFLSGKFQHQSLRCMFWNFSKQIYGQWDDSGCFRISSNESHVTCSCNHLTNFAVLMDVNNNVEEDKILTMLTYICCSLSSLTLVITLICFSSIRSLYGRRSIITGNLCFSLLLTNLLILFGLDQTYNKIVCATIAGFLHFWILSAFCWMLVEGYHLYKMVVLVFERGRTLSIKVYYLFAYGAPLIIVSISAGLRKDDYGGEIHCWLSPNNGLMWSFVGPACAIILINVVIFVLTLRSASSVRVKREQTTLKKIKSWARGSMSVMCLLGLTWCLGLFYIDKNLSIFSYIFTVLNGLQGVFIFFFHIVLNDKVTSLFCCKGAKNEVWKRCLPQTSSNHLHSKLSTRTSLNSLGCVSSNIPVTSVNSRRVSNMSYQNSHRENDNIKRLKARSRRNYSFESNNVYCRKEKACHTVSENGLTRLPPSQRFKPRSQSYPEAREDRIPSQNIELKYRN